MQRIIEGKDQNNKRCYYIQDVGNDGNILWSINPADPHTGIINCGNNDRTISICDVPKPKKDAIHKSAKKEIRTPRILQIFNVPLFLITIPLHWIARIFDYFWLGGFIINEFFHKNKALRITRFLGPIALAFIIPFFINLFMFYDTFYAFFFVIAPLIVRVSHWILTKARADHDGDDLECAEIAATHTILSDFLFDFKHSSDLVVGRITKEETDNSFFGYNRFAGTRGHAYKLKPAYIYTDDTCYKITPDRYRYWNIKKQLEDYIEENGYTITINELDKADLKDALSID